MFTKTKPFLMITLGAAAALLQSGFAANLNCPTCRVQLAQRDQVVLSRDASSTLDESMNVAALLNRPSPIQLTAQVSPFPKNVKGWDGTGELPGAFQRPWEMPKTNFDPSFVTPYYSQQTGPVNVPSAPWNLFLPPALANGFYNLGMMNLGYVPSFSSGVEI